MRLGERIDQTAKLQACTLSQSGLLCPLNAKSRDSLEKRSSHALQSAVAPG
jgi:hypothetical protein